MTPLPPGDHPDLHLSSDQYAKQEGTECRFCLSHLVWITKTEAFQFSIYRTIECSDCNKDWVDVFTFNHFLDEG